MTGESLSYDCSTTFGFDGFAMRVSRQNKWTTDLIRPAACGVIGQWSDQTRSVAPARWGSLNKTLVVGLAKSPIASEGTLARFTTEKT